MVTLIANFLREQGILIMLGWMLAGGILRQVMTVRRYRRLRAEIRSLTALQADASGNTQSVIAGVQSSASEPESGLRQVTANRKDSARKRRARREVEYGQAEPARLESLQKGETTRESVEAIHSPSQSAELDAQLFYLKQSLDRIAAGRDQKLEEETREHRKLTPEQEAIIADILREYLS